MTVHRITQIAHVLDPAWSDLQTDPRDTILGLIEPIKTVGTGVLLWRAVGYDGAGPGARPVDSSGCTFDAKIVWREMNNLGPGIETRSLAPISESYGSQFAFGRSVREVDLPIEMTAYLQITALTIVGPATHVWWSWSWGRDL